MTGARFALALAFVAIGAVLACLFACLSSCLAVKPISVDGGGAPLPPIADADPACFACLKAADQPGPGCQMEYDGCQSAPECAESFTCAVANGCFATGSLGGIGVCGLPCVYDSGITSFNDPAFKSAVALFKCLSGPCAMACHVAGDAQ